jgi:hypothetical protein
MVQFIVLKIKILPFIVQEYSFAAEAAIPLIQNED